VTVEAVFFDLDGTLVDTAPDFVVILNRMLREAGKAELAPAVIRKQVSNGAGALVTLGFGMGRGEPGFNEHLERLLDLYSNHLDVETRLFPGMAEVLAELEQRDIAWGVVTNKPERFARPVLDGLGLMDSISAIVCPDNVTLRKPDPEALFLACHQAGVTEPEHCLYVGDHVRDVQAGHRAGMATVACTFGYIADGDDPTGWGAEYVIDHARELLPIIDHLSEKRIQGAAHD
jgi:phosphoglycolate phosphatase